MSRSSEAVRSMPYPVLEPGSLSYENGEYAVSGLEMGADGASVALKHEIAGAPLLESLLREQKAKYACLVSAPSTGYRRLELSDEAAQTVSWDSRNIGEPPMLRPLIVAVKEEKRCLKPEDGVAEEWRRPVEIPVGARLALHEYLRVNSSLQQLIELIPDDTMKPGGFIVSACTDGGFSFQVKAAKNLCTFLQNPQGYREHRMSVLTHMAGRCFELLQKDYVPADSGPDNEDSDWQAFPNLRALYAFLQGKNLPGWDEDGFDPAEVATKLYPHNPPDPRNGEDNGK